MAQVMEHPLDSFRYCPRCGANVFEACNEKAKRCGACGFEYYCNPSASVACFLRNKQGELLLVRRREEPAKGTLDLPGGFVDLHETIEESVRREVWEETSLSVRNERYLFSLPNVYMYAGFAVHTLDLFFECEVDHFEQARAADDAEAIVIRHPEALDPAAFGLDSIRRAIPIYQRLIRKR